MKLTFDKDWFRRHADSYDDVEIGAGGSQLDVTHPLAAIPETQQSGRPDRLSAFDDTGTPAEEHAPALRQ